MCGLRWRARQVGGDGAAALKPAAEEKWSICNVWFILILFRHLYAVYAYGPYGPVYAGPGAQGSRFIKSRPHLGGVGGGEGAP